MALISFFSNLWKAALVECYPISSREPGYNSGLASEQPGAVALPLSFGGLEFLAIRPQWRAPPSVPCPLSVPPCRLVSPQGWAGAVPLCPLRVGPGGTAPLTGSGATAAAPLPGGGSGAMAAQDVLGQTARLASSSALLQVRGRPSLLPPPPALAAAAARRGAAGASRAASFTGAVPGGHLRAERLHPPLPVPGAHRRGQCQVRELSGHPGGLWGQSLCWSVPCHWRCSD